MQWVKAFLTDLNPLMRSDENLLALVPERGICLEDLPFTATEEVQASSRKSETRKCLLREASSSGIFTARFMRAKRMEQRKSSRAVFTLESCGDDLLEIVGLKSSHSSSSKVGFASCCALSFATAAADFGFLVLVLVLGNLLENLSGPFFLFVGLECVDGRIYIGLATHRGSSSMDSMVI